MKKHTEIRLEEAIVETLIKTGGWIFIDYNKGPAIARYDKTRALDPTLVLQFIQRTQDKVWKRLVAIHGHNASQVVLDHLVKELEIKGTLKVLRQGFKCYGLKFRLAIFAAANRMNPDTLALYENNVLSVTRQLYYSEENSNCPDLFCIDVWHLPRFDRKAGSLIPRLRLEDH